MATNQAGYPYPLGTDRVMDGDDAIKALAAAVPWVQQGQVSMGAGDGSTQKTIVVTFPKAFPAAPTAGFATPVTAASSTATTQSWAVYNITASSIGLSVTRSNTTAVTMNWCAIYTGGNIP